MKIDRLLSICFYLLNRDIVSARELADKFDVSVRTINRDMDTLTYAGIPIVSRQGAQGGFGIMNTYKLNKQLVDTNDLFFILTALESIGAAYPHKKLDNTFEKVKNLVDNFQNKEFEKRKQNLYIDFSAFGLGQNAPDLFEILEAAIENQKLIAFEYTDSNYKITSRLIEPMTIVFKWYAWYLFGFCREKEDYRFFRISRMAYVKVQNQGFSRRDISFEEFDKEYETRQQGLTELHLKFSAVIKNYIQDYFSAAHLTVNEDDSTDVIVKMPENEWLYNMILSYGEKVEVIKPVRIRNLIISRLQKSIKNYSLK